MAETAVGGKAIDGRGGGVNGSRLQQERERRKGEREELGHLSEEGSFDLHSNVPPPLVSLNTDDADADMDGDSITLLCSFGGEFSRDNGNLYYEGGTTSLIRVQRTISYSCILSRMSEKFSSPVESLGFSYQYPGESLDRLISVQSDNDVRNMMEECSDRINIFIFSNQIKPEAIETPRHEQVLSPDQVSLPKSSEYESHRPSSGFTSGQEVINYIFAPQSNGHLDTQQLYSFLAQQLPGRTTGQQSDSSPVPQQLLQDAVPQNLREFLDSNKGLTTSVGIPSTFSHGNSPGTLASVPAPSTLASGSTSSMADGSVPSIPASKKKSRARKTGSSSSALACGCSPRTPKRTPKSATHKSAASSKSAPPSKSATTSKSASMSKSAPVTTRKKSRRSQRLLAKSTSGHPPFSLVVGQEFPDVSAYRSALREAAIVSGCELKYVKSERRRVTAKCLQDGCPFHIHASQLSGQKKFKVKSLNPVHNCVVTKSQGDRQDRGHRQATSAWVASNIEEQLKVNLDYTPREIITQIKDAYGINLPYEKAWKGKMAALKKLSGPFERSFKHLPGYCAEIERSNPGSIAKVFARNGGFHRAFVAFNAAICGFRSCKPLIGLGANQLRGPYRGMLVAATAVDANGQLFPLAFAVVESEKKGNWRWFLEQLKTLLQGSSMLTFISNQRKFLIKAVRNVFPDAYHVFCVQSLIVNLQKKNPCPVLREHFWAAARVCRLDEFDRIMERIEQISFQAHLWIKKRKPESWATSKLVGCRYGHLTLNMSESLNNWLKDAKDLPITQLIDHLHKQLMEMFYNRKKLGLEWPSSILAPEPEEELRIAKEISNSYQVYQASLTEFEVHGDIVRHVVDIGNWNCTCGRWQASRQPCAHAIACVRHIKGDIHQYCDDSFTVAKYLETYSKAVHPLDESRWVKKKVKLQPPKWKKPPGRPKVAEACTETRKTNSLHCGSCGECGHNSRTCHTKRLKLS